MRFTFCPHCGEKLIRKEIGDEGLIPYCEHCKVPLWDLFTTCVICAVVTEDREIALLRQNYVSTTNYVCVAGVMKPAESAEEAAMREVNEELGLKVEALEYVRSYPFEQKEMLMLGFRARVQKADFQLSGEVDKAQWFPLSEAPAKLRQGGIAWRLVSEIAGKEG